jgi:hypothetical protein
VDKTALTIDEVARTVASLSGISFDDAKCQIKAVLRELSTPSAAATEELSKTLFFSGKKAQNTHLKKPVKT